MFKSNLIFYILFYLSTSLVYILIPINIAEARMSCLFSDSFECKYFDWCGKQSIKGSECDCISGVINDVFEGEERELFYEYFVVSSENNMPKALSIIGKFDKDLIIMQSIMVSIAEKMKNKCQNNN